MFSCRLFQTRFTLPASRTDKNPVPQFSSHFPLASFYIRSCSTDRSPEGLRRRNCRHKKTSVQCRHHGNIRRKGTPLGRHVARYVFFAFADRPDQPFMDHHKFTSAIVIFSLMSSDLSQRAVRRSHTRGSVYPPEN